MPGELGCQTALENGFDQLGEHAAVAGQRQAFGVDPAHQIIEQAGRDHPVHRLARRRRRIARRPRRSWIISHGHVCTPQLKG
jgi:hypothetical protein